MEVAVKFKKVKSMRKIMEIVKENFEPIGKIDYGVFIIFFIITMLFVLTIVKNI